MRRFSPLVAALALAPVVACDGGTEPVASADTVAIGSLPAPVATTVATTDVTTTATTGATSAPPPTSPPAEPTVAPAPTDGPAPTVFVELLDRLVEDEPPPQLATVSLVDDTGRLRMDVPDDWADRRSEPSRLADDTATPALAAAPDLTAFLDGFDTPGITALVVAGTPGGALAAYTFGESCLVGDRGAYRTDGLEGRYAVWESCGGTFNDIVTVAVRAPDADHSVLLLVQIVGAADLVALDAALGSLRLDA